MVLNILICLAAFLALISFLRKTGLSLGLPVAYLFSLLFIHLPGGLVHAIGGDTLVNSEVVAKGIGFTTIGSVCFIAGVWLARHSAPKRKLNLPADRGSFEGFCLFGGWFIISVLSPLHRVPSLGAAVDQAGGIWMLGAMLGLRAAVRRGDVRRVAKWVGAMMLYPIGMLLLGGFVSYGAAAVIIVGSILTVSTRRFGRIIVGLVIVSFVGLSVFVAYFQHRNGIREQVWGGAPLEARIASVTDMFIDFRWFDPSNPAHQSAIDQRLNQNYVAGLAALRIEQGQVKYLNGRSIWEGLLALVPRALWPEKTVAAGSGSIVSEMTGLRLDPTTSWGVGNVMEFYINFGIPGVIGGFLLLGWAIGALDLRAAVADDRGDLCKVIIFFLPCVALIQPIGSIVELSSGSAAALVAAFGWRWVLRYRTRQKSLALRKAGRRQVEVNKGLCRGDQFAS